MTQQLPNGKQQFIDINGKPLVGGFVHHYEVGTNTPKTTYQDFQQTIPNTNPVVLDARGQASIYGTGPYRQVLNDADGNLIWDQVVIDPSSAVAQFFLDLANKVDPTKGSALVGWISPLPNAVGRTLSEKLQDYINVKDFGAKGDGIQNDTPFINSALEQANIQKKACYFPGGQYLLDESTPGSGFCLFNKGVSMIGDGALRTMLIPKASLVSTADYIMIQPTATTVLDFMELSGFIIYPNNPGSKRGKRAIVVDMTAASNANAVHIDGIYCAPGNDYSVAWVTQAVNIQGGPANSLIERSSFWEGMSLVNNGDSISIRNCVFRSSVSSGRIGIEAEGINVSGGQPSQLNIHECNFDCNGGAYHAKNGLSGSFCNNNVEQTAGTGSGSGAVVDIDGNATAVGYMEVSGNNFGVFGTAAVGQAIRVNNATGVKLSNNRMLSAGPAFAATGVLITANATDTTLEGNEISTGFTTPVSDFGSGTRGLQKAVSPLNGYSNSGGGSQTLAVNKTPDGVCFVRGTLSYGGVGNSVLFGSLPIGFRPSLITDAPAIAVVGGALAPARITVGTNGDLVVVTNAAPTQVYVDLNFGGLGYTVGNL
jgi:hypothetical protein